MKHYVITDVAADGTITAKPIDHNEPIMPGMSRPDSFTGKMREIVPAHYRPVIGHVIRAEVTGIAEVLSSTKGSDADDEGETPAGMG